MSSSRFKYFFLLIVLASSSLVSLGLFGLAVVQAATFSMQTGYYVGDGSSGHSVTGVGFQPQLLIIKDDTANGSDGVVWSSSAMPSGTTAKTADGDADVTNGTYVTSLDSDGFTVGNAADINALSVRFTYIAFAGSDCTSNGTFCVGSYSGNGTAGRAITSVGFSPDAVWIKRSGASAGVFRTSSMANNVTQFFANTAQNTTGAEFRTLDPTGFTLGNNAIVNASGSNYWFAAFKKVGTAMNVGSYTGTGAANSISGMGFAPDMVLFKNSNASTAQVTGYNIAQSNGDYSSTFTDAANTIGNVTTLDSNGFSVGATTAANGLGNTIFWMGFGGSLADSGSGNFTSATGSYTGNGTSQSITGLGFRPDFVITSTDSQDTAWRTPLMKGDSTAVFASGTANFAGGITSLDSDGFSVGTAAETNSAGAVYYWSAFGNGWNPETRSGSAEFAFGVYTANETANRDILNLPFQPDLVIVKRNGTNAGVWRSSAHVGDVSSFFPNTADAANNIQSLLPAGFEVGTANSVSAAGSLYNWVAFKAGPRLAVGSYTGNGSSQSITGLGLVPRFVWTKRSTNTAGAFTMSSVPAGTSLRFGSAANTTTGITSLDNEGFSVGSGSEANANGATYRYVAWGVPPIISVTVSDGAINYGNLGSGEFKDTTAGGINDSQQMNNNGNVSEDFNIKTSSPAGWTLGAAPSLDTFVHEFSTNGGSNWTKFTAADSYQTLFSNLAAGGNQTFDLKLTAPNPSTSGAQKIITVTIQASQH